MGFQSNGCVNPWSGSKNARRKGKGKGRGPDKAGRLSSRITRIASQRIQVMKPENDENIGLQQAFDCRNGLKTEALI